MWWPITAAIVVVAWRAQLPLVLYTATAIITVRLWTRYRALTAWRPAAIAVAAVRVAQRHCSHGRRPFLELAVAARGDAGALRRAGAELPKMTTEMQSRSMASAALDAAVCLVEGAERPARDVILHRVTHPIVVVAAPPLLALSWEIARNPALDLVAIAYVALTWGAVRERYHTLPRQLARSAVMVAADRPVAEELETAMVVPDGQPASVLDEALGLVTLTSQFACIEGAAAELIRNAASPLPGRDRW